MRPTVDVGAGPVVVLVHGQPGSAIDWYRVVPLLEHDHRVIAVDRHGYAGRRDVALDWAGNAEALVQMLDDLGIDRCIVVAHSWAGGIGLEVTAAHPERVDGLVLVSTVGHKSAITRGDRFWNLRIPAWFGEVAARRAGPRAARFFEWASGSRLGHEEREALKIALQLHREQGSWAANRLEQSYMIRDTERLHDLLGDVHVPTTVISGQRDLLVPIASARALVEALPDAELREVEGGHFLTVEHPQAIAEAVRDRTLRDHSPSARTVE